MPDRRTLWEIEVPFRRTLETVTGPIGSRRSVVVAVAIDGVTGWGEAPAFPSGRFGTAAEAFEDLATEDEPSVPIARAALQAAIADAEARAAGVALHTHLGGTDDAVMARHPIGLTDAEAIGVEAAWLQTHGITAVKLKITPGRDRAVVESLRAQLPDLDIGVDANGSYAEPGDLTWLDAARVSFVEQPFPPGDLTKHAALRERIATPVCLDEAVPSPGAVERALTAGAADQISVKVNRSGLEALGEILAITSGTGVSVRIGGTFDTSIGRRHVLAAATLPPIVDAEAGPPSAYLASDVVGYPAVVDGQVKPDSTPGIGVVPDRRRLDEMAIRSTTI